jgi:hypothetical protein
VFAGIECSGAGIGIEAVVDDRAADPDVLAVQAGGRVGEIIAQFGVSRHGVSARLRGMRPRGWRR